MSEIHQPAKGQLKAYAPMLEKSSEVVHASVPALHRGEFDMFYLTSHLSFADW